MAQAKAITGHRRLLALLMVGSMTSCAVALLAWWLLPLFAPKQVIRYSPSFHWAVNVQAHYGSEHEEDAFIERIARDKPYSAYVLSTYLTAKDEALRIAAVKGLRYCAGPPETLLLCSALKDESERVRLYAAQALETYQDRAMVNPLMERLTHSDEYLSVFILKALREQALTDEEVHLLQPRAKRVGLGNLFSSTSATVP